MHILLQAQHYDNYNFFEWQTQLQVHSYYKSKQDQCGDMTCMLATDTRIWGIGSIDVIPYPSVAFYGGDDDSYPNYNRPYGMLHWVENTKTKDDTVCCLDPDMVFLDKLPNYRPQRGYPIAQRSQVVAPDHPHAQLAAKYYDSTKLELEPVSVPYIMHIDDLRMIAPRWLEWTRILRRGEKETLGHMCEMWAYMIAAAECGFKHEIPELEIAWTITGEYEQAPMVHYAYPGEYFVPGWSWNKREYKPWERVYIPENAPKPMACVMDMLTDFATIQRVREVTFL